MLCSVTAVRDGAWSEPMIRRMLAGGTFGALALAFAVLAFAVPPASAQVPGQEKSAQSASRENLMTACGDEWRAVREIEAANGVTWPQFLARCRAQAADGATESASGRQAASRPAASAPATSTQAAEPQRAPRRSQTAAAQGPVFPQDIAARHASERPALGRQRTCADQSSRTRRRTPTAACAGSSRAAATGAAATRA